MNSAAIVNSFCVDNYNLFIEQLPLDVRAWLIAVSADRQAGLSAERITRMVIRGTHLGAAHDVPRE